MVRSGEKPEILLNIVQDGTHAKELGAQNVTNTAIEDRTECSACLLNALYEVLLSGQCNTGNSKGTPL